MQFEIKITSHDLKVILIDVTGKPLWLTLKLNGSEELIEDVNVLDFDTQKGLITVSNVSEPSLTQKISYLEIECLEFQSFYKYKSSSAKNFNIE